MTEPPFRIWFHGTNEAGAKRIIDEGFRPGTYFARGLEDALEFGGPFVIWTALNIEPAIPGNWQMLVAEAVPAANILKIIHYWQHITFEASPIQSCKFFAEADFSAPPQETQS